MMLYGTLNAALGTTVGGFAGGEDVGDGGCAVREPERFLTPNADAEAQDLYPCSPCRDKFNQDACACQAIADRHEVNKGSGLGLQQVGGGVPIDQ
jgi:hypothetical protein